MDEDDPFPWEAVYRALVRRICQMNDQRPYRLLASDVAALAIVHGEVLKRQDGDD